MNEAQNKQMLSKTSPTLQALIPINYNYKFNTKTAQTLCLVMTNKKKKEVADINYLLVQQPEEAKHAI